MSKIKKIILVLVILLILVAVFLAVRKIGVFKTGNSETNESASVEKDQADQKIIIKGEITKASPNSVSLKNQNGKNVDLKISSEGIKYFQEMEKDKSLTLRELSLLESKKGLQAEAEYNAESKEIISLKVFSE